MDPATLSILMRALAPVLGMLAFATIPIGLQERAALPEGPATAAGAEAASLVRGRER